MELGQIIIYLLLMVISVCLIVTASIYREHEFNLEEVIVPLGTFLSLFYIAHTGFALYYYQDGTTVPILVYGIGAYIFHSFLYKRAVFKKKPTLAMKYWDKVELIGIIVPNIFFIIFNTCNIAHFSIFKSLLEAFSGR